MAPLNILKILVFILRKSVLTRRPCHTCVLILLKCIVLRHLDGSYFFIISVLSDAQTQSFVHATCDLQSDVVVVGQVFKSCYIETVVSVDDVIHEVGVLLILIEYNSLRTIVFCSIPSTFRIDVVHPSNVVLVALNEYVAVLSCQLLAPKLESRILRELIHFFVVILIK